MQCGQQRVEKYGRHGMSSVRMVREARGYEGAGGGNSAVGCVGVIAGRGNPASWPRFESWRESARGALDTGVAVCSAAASRSSQEQGGSGASWLAVNIGGSPGLATDCGKSNRDRERLKQALWNGFAQVQRAWSNREVGGAPAGWESEKRYELLEVGRPHFNTNITNVNITSLLDHKAYANEQSGVQMTT
ncbi:hypothetical protein B0H17DRAFT_1133140 [Mycena rosella]|uniref:Uncharacterized protein n=1 Tax=Mycena rosella TaxID=1033263 RepID=A0AAD7DIV5_MYCRO|nr:hypothetical protein B0H17DRAFT_1133140 [Mycena rosella]